MANVKLVSISGVVGALIVVACSSNESGKSGSGTGGTGPLINLNNLGAMAATDTENGMQPLTPEQAETLKDPTGACQAWTREPEGGPAALEFQVDTSHSMSESADSTGGQSKWQVMETALPQAFANLPASWAVGITFFNRTQSGCYQGSQAVPIAPLTQDQLTALTNAIPAAAPVADPAWTPTEAAYVFALQQMQNFAGSNRYVVLVTDGVPTINSDGCAQGPGTQASITLQEYDHFINTVATQTTDTGIKTFVVGVPGSEDPQSSGYDPMYQLSLVAQAGGTAVAGCTPVAGTVAGNHSISPRGTYCHYDMTQTTDFAQGLISTIGTIADSVMTCNFTVPAPPAGQSIDPNRVNMVYDDGAGNSFLVLQNTNADCDRGWHFTDDTHQYITVCSITCDLVQKNPAARMTLTFGCTSNQIPA